MTVLQFIGFQRMQINIFDACSVMFENIKILLISYIQAP